MKKYSKYWLSKYFLYTGLSLLTITISLTFFFHRKLAITQKVNANVLVIEGWLPNYALHCSYIELKDKIYNIIVTTGLRNSSKYFNIFTNGSLVFYLSGKNHINDTLFADHLIDIKAYSSLGFKNKAHFDVLINNHNAGSFYAGLMKHDYSIVWNGRLSEIDSVTVRFLNDTVTLAGDRNLFVKDVTIDHSKVIPFQTNSVFVFNYMDQKIVIKNNYNSDAEYARNILIYMGIDSTHILDLPAEETSINRTLTSALEFRHWADTTHFDIKGVNVVTLGSHARRTWMIYQKILGKRTNVGIISIPDYRERHFIFRVFKTVRELLGIVYYLIFLIPSSVK